MYNEETKRKVLAAMPGTEAEITAKVKMSNTHVRAVISHLMLQGKAHIGSWQRGDAQKPRRVYHQGPGDKPEVPRFFQRPKAQRTGVWRDPLVAALFGEVAK